MNAGIGVGFVCLFLAACSGDRSGFDAPETTSTVTDAGASEFSATDGGPRADTEPGTPDGEVAADASDTDSAPQNSDASRDDTSDTDHTSATERSDAGGSASDERDAQAAPPRTDSGEPQSDAAPGVVQTDGGSTECASNTAMECGCPEGYIPQSDTCAPVLLSLTLEGLTLSPGFASEVFTYTLQAPIFLRTLALTATAAATVDLRVNGQALTSGESWTSPVLDLGENVVEVELLQGDQVTQTYHLSVTRGEPAAYLKASNVDAEDLFGGAVALSADGRTLAVGANGEASESTGVNGNQSNNDAASAGAVYVFVRSDAGAWVQQAYLKASNADGGDWFGASVALSANGDTLVVGAPLEQGASTGVGGDQGVGQMHAGAVYLFTRDVNTWTQQAYVKASNTGSTHLFGSAVDLSDDGNTLVVGAHNEYDTIEPDEGVIASGRSGAVYTYTREGTIWTHQAYIKASNAEAGDRFGFSVALSGDGTTLAVGAYDEASGVKDAQDNNDAPGAGAAYVFTRSASGWRQQAYIKASNPGEGDRFARTVSLSSDGNTLAVGADQEDGASSKVNGAESSEGAQDAGAVYVFVRSDSTWSKQAYIKAFSAVPGANFGSGVSLTEDGSRLAVGAPQDGLGGAAYFYYRVGDAWSADVHLTAFNGASLDRHGISLALSGDGQVLAVGAPDEDSSDTNPNDNQASSAGAVYVYR